MKWKEARAKERNSKQEKKKTQQVSWDSGFPFKLRIFMIYKHVCFYNYILSWRWTTTPIIPDCLSRTGQDDKAWRSPHAINCPCREPTLTPTGAITPDALFQPSHLCIRSFMSHTTVKWPLPYTARLMGKDSIHSMIYNNRHVAQHSTQEKIHKIRRQHRAIKCETDL